MTRKPRLLGAGNQNRVKEMQLMKFENHISWMDIIALAGVAVALVNAHYGLGVQVAKNTQHIEQNQEAIVRLEKNSHERDVHIASSLDKLEQAMVDIRKESAQERRLINDKLDRLIERL